ncbi:hypothetical protein QBC40DRAFT_301397 [Triangularia verruculosa]|uniref:Uncharacterized protein n=1 Tax=Triangularia verruculosa TaxID=2587418 RepID=A0AAN7ANF1_9PEZI|nr:hypothetical protein QBC40DRAFT_301397 [Triangularia verruculosa]
MKSLALLSILSSLTGVHAAVAAEANTAAVAADAIALNTFKDAVWSAEALPQPLRGPGYKPLIPASYVGCIFDPTGPFGQLDFTYLTPNGLALTRDRRTNRAIEETDSSASVPGLYFEPPNNVFSPRGIYDVRLPGENGRPDRYLAVFKNGEVGWVLRSTNGQTALRDDRGEPYVTTILSLQCNGLSTAGILNGLEFEFMAKDNKLYARGIPPTKKHSHVFSRQDGGDGEEDSAALLRGAEVVALGGSQEAKKNNRQQQQQQKLPSITVGLYVLPRLQEIDVTKTCPSGTTFTTRDPPFPVTSNGCGPFDWWRSYFVPKLHETFEDACNWVDVCWTDCTQTFKSCNDGFYARLLDRCNERFRTESSLSSCRNLAKAYLQWNTIPQRVTLWEATIDQHCYCRCPDPSLSVCGNQCVDYRNDPYNCGSCGHVCQNSGTCINGVCSSSCTIPWTCNFPGEFCNGFDPEQPAEQEVCLCAATAGSAGNVCVWAGDVCGARGCFLNSDCAVGSACVELSCCSSAAYPGICVPLREDFCANPGLPRVGLLSTFGGVGGGGQRLFNPAPASISLT